jgi:hypothetical protein
LQDFLGSIFPPFFSFLPLYVISRFVSAFEIRITAARALFVRQRTHRSADRKPAFHITLYFNTPGNMSEADLPLKEL